MSERDATRHFCHYSPYAQQVFRDEIHKPSSLFGFYPKTHKESCQDWQGILWNSNDTELPVRWEDKFRHAKPPAGFVIPKWDQTQFDLDHPHFNISALLGNYTEIPEDGADESPSDVSDEELNGDDP